MHLPTSIAKSEKCKPCTTLHYNHRKCGVDVADHMVWL